MEPDVIVRYHDDNFIHNFSTSEGASYPTPLDETHLEKQRNLLTFLYFAA